MSSESSATREAWHAELAEKDNAVRSMSDSRSVEAENAALHQRLEGLMAELRIARSAVAVRDAILREQTAALRERELDLAVVKSHLETIQATLWRRLTSRAARVLRAPRRLTRR